jgi:predicted transposase/invertase (TIGR01784 family)
LKYNLESIEKFDISNPEMLPEALGEKFCRLDINMLVNGQRVDLEIQVNDEKDYPERSLYYWAREYSSALSEGKDYLELPRTIVISILGFNLFPCKEFHSEFRALEVKRHTELTDKMSLHYFELPKLPEVVNADDELKLWLSLFKANTEEELNKIEKLGVPIMRQAINAYRHISATDEFKQLEKIRFEAKSNEAAALRNAKQEGKQEGRQEAMQQLFAFLNSGHSLEEAQKKFAFA